LPVMSLGRLAQHIHKVEYRVAAERSR